MEQLTVSSLYAQSQSFANAGKMECHWCGSACDNRTAHDDPPPQPFTKGKSNALRPHSAYTCKGCWLWRRTRITIPFLDSEKDPPYLDRQAPFNHSWLITPAQAWAIRPLDFPRLTQLLNKPPLKFGLSILTGKGPNYLHLVPVNNHESIKADTVLHFSLDNVPQSFSIYELEFITQTKDSNGLMSGTRALASLLGLDKEPIVPAAQVIGEPQEEKKRGRPAGQQTSIPHPGKRTVRG